MLQDFVIVETGQVVALEVEPHERLDSKRFAVTEPSETILDAAGKTHSVEPGEYTLEPYTYDPRRWRRFREGHMDGPLRVLDATRWPWILERDEGTLLFWPDADRVAWKGATRMPRPGAAELIPEPPATDGPTLIGSPNYAIAHGDSGDPFARSLPRRKPREGRLDTLDGRPAIRYKDGGYSDLQGRPAVRNRRDYESERSRTGMERD